MNKRLRNGFHVLINDHLPAWKLSVQNMYLCYSVVWGCGYYENIFTVLWAPSLGPSPQRNLRCIATISYCHHIEYRCIHDKRFLGPHDLKCLKKLQPWQYYLDSFVLTHFSTWSISAKFWLNLWGVVEYYRQLVYVPFRFRPSQGSPNRR